MAAAATAALTLAGASTALASSSGTVWDWGDNGYGELGNGSYAGGSYSATPVEVLGADNAPALTDVTAVTGGGYFKLALKSDGTVWGWGAGSGAVLTDPFLGVAPRPVQLKDLSSVTSVVAGSGYGLALESDGSVLSWGSNATGQLGNGTWSSSADPTPTRISSLSSVVAVAARTGHSLALKSDGTVWTWGENDNGELGQGSTSGPNSCTSSIACSTTPVEVPHLSSIVAIASGSSFDLAVKSDGTVYGWGDNSGGQLGDGSTTSRYSPVAVKGPGGTGSLSSITAVAAGTDHTIALDSSGGVWTWGYNPSTTGVRFVTSPESVSGISSATAIAAGGGTDFALTAGGEVWGWGWNAYGEVGDGSAAGPNCYHCAQPTPMPVVGPDGKGTLAPVIAIGTDDAGDGAAVRAESPPGPPGAPATDSALTHAGAITLSWAAATDPDGDPVTYTLQHHNELSAPWTTVATGLTSASYAFGQVANAAEGEGTWSYRVQAVDANGNAGPFAEADKLVVVDKTAPNAPTLTADTSASQSPTYKTGSGVSWYRDSELIDVTATGDPALADGSPGSGVDPGSFPAQLTDTANGASTASQTVKDRAGNESAPGTLAAYVDAQPPTVHFTNCPTTAVLQGSGGSVAWTASDGESGLATPASGSGSLDTSTPGEHSLKTPATSDNVGHVATPEVCRYTVATLPAPTITSPADGSANDSGHVTVAGTTAGPTSSVTVYDGSTKAGSATPDRSGNWTLTVAAAEGQHTYTAAAQYNGASSPQSAPVRVGVDLDVPTLSLPPDRSTLATSPAGAVVDYTATASDDDGSVGPVTCSQPSGSTFPIGTTAVTCSVSDWAGNKTTGTFKVNVANASSPVSCAAWDVSGDWTWTQNGGGSGPSDGPAHLIQSGSTLTGTVTNVTDLYTEVWTVSGTIDGATVRLAMTPPESSLLVGLNDYVGTIASGGGAIVGSNYGSFGAGHATCSVQATVPAVQRGSQVAVVLDLTAPADVSAEIFLGWSVRSAGTRGGPVVLGRLTRFVHAGQARLHVRLNGRGRRLLARHRSLKAMLSVTVTPKGARTPTTTVERAIKIKR